MSAVAQFDCGYVVSGMTHPFRASRDDSPGCLRAVDGAWDRPEVVR